MGMHTVKLPSGGKQYGNDGVVKIRTLKSKDEKIIADMTETNLEEKFLELIDAVSGDVPAKYLTLGDRKYILLWLAINSYTPIHKLTFRCEHCLKENKNVEVDLQKINVVELPEELQLPVVVSVTTEVDGKEEQQDVKVRLLTTSDEVYLTRAEAKGKNTWLMKSALSIGDGTDEGIAAAEEFIGELSSMDHAKIRHVQEKYDHGPDMLAPYVCKECKGVGKVAVPFQLEMLLPYGAVLSDIAGKAG